MKDKSKTSVPASIRYIVCRLVRWDSLRVGAYTVENPHPGCIGFLPVFEDAESARKEYPDSVLQMIEELPRKEGM